MKNKYGHSWIYIISILGLLGILGLRSIEGVQANMSYGTNEAHVQISLPKSDKSGESLTRLNIHCDANNTLTIDSSTSNGTYYPTKNGERGISWDWRQKNFSHTHPGWCR